MISLIRIIMSNLIFLSFTLCNPLITHPLSICLFRISRHRRHPDNTPSHPHLHDLYILLCQGLDCHSCCNGVGVDAEEEEWEEEWEEEGAGAEVGLVLDSKHP